jgi:hypothetical protein
MAIKSAVVLACTGGHDYTQFRRVSDVERFATEVELSLKTCLASLRRETKWLTKEEAGFVAAYSHPPVKVNKHLDVLHELFDKVEQLDSILAMLVSGFGHMPKAQALISRLQALIAYTKNKVDKALSQLSLAVDRHQPEFFQRVCQALMGQINRLGGYSSCTPMSLLRVVVDHSTGKPKGTQFSTYLCFKDLVDATGYCHQRYHVVVSCVVDKFGRYSMNYALQPNILLPGRFRTDSMFDTAKEGWGMICNSMREEGFAWEAAA